MVASPSSFSHVYHCPTASMKSFRDTKYTESAFALDTGRSGLVPQAVGEDGAAAPVCESGNSVSTLLPRSFTSDDSYVL